MKKDLYICFSNIDRNYVIPVVVALETAGLSCCLPGRDLDVGPEWEDLMVDAVYSSQMILYFDSEAARDSRRIRKELETINESGFLRIDIPVPDVSAQEIVEMVRNRFREAQSIRDGNKRLVPYSGRAPYIFVSYAHRNKEKVFPMIRTLQQDGYRIWFDEGIDPGTEWADNIALHLSSARFFIACMSGEYLESTNCSDELAYARVLKLPILLIYLEPLQLEDANKMRYEDCPSVACDLLSDAESFCKAVAQAENIQICREINQEGISDV